MQTVTLSEHPDDLGWERVLPETIGALTDGEIWSDGTYLYWHERYAIEDFDETLATQGLVRVVRVEHNP